MIRTWSAAPKTVSSTPSRNSFCDMARAYTAPRWRCSGTNSTRRTLRKRHFWPHGRASTDSAGKPSSRPGFIKLSPGCASTSSAGTHQHPSTYAQTSRQLNRTTQRSKQSKRCAMVPSTTPSPSCRHRNGSLLSFITLKDCPTLRSLRSRAVRCLRCGAIYSGRAGCLPTLCRIGGKNRQ